MNWELRGASWYPGSDYLDKRLVTYDFNMDDTICYMTGFSHRDLRMWLQVFSKQLPISKLFGRLHRNKQRPQPRVSSPGQLPKETGSQMAS